MGAQINIQNNLGILSTHILNEEFIALWDSPKIGGFSQWCLFSNISREAENEQNINKLKVSLAQLSRFPFSSFNTNMAMALYRCLEKL